MQNNLLPSAIMDHKKNRNTYLTILVKLRNKIVSKKAIEGSASKLRKTESRKIGMRSKKLKSQDQITPNTNRDDLESQRHFLSNKCRMKCTVCLDFIPCNEKENSISFIEHPFFSGHKMCPKHENTTRKCVACHILEPYDQK